MSEKIYTIPVNEAFDAELEASSSGKECGCPFCRLYKKLQEDEIGIILGAAKMSSDIRLKTNEKGFCGTHLRQMMKKQGRLSLGLLLESHLDTVREQTKGGDGFLSKLKKTDPTERLKTLEQSCYLCERIGYSFERMLTNAALLWYEDESFRKKTEKQPYFCLPHYRMWLEYGKAALDKKSFQSFSTAVSDVVGSYFDELREDVSWFCKKFDYRYENEPWKNSKDAIERAEKFLCSDTDEK